MKWIKNKEGSVYWCEENVKNTRDILNQKGQGFCLAKWKQVTMHLESGLVHSCHHPKVHLVPLDELKKSPSALFNSNYLKSVRKQMLNNEKPSECNYCWRIENNNNYSDRYHKSLQDWALPYYDEVIKYSGDETVYPTYLEVSFSNVCNMQCLYCKPEFSSKWQEEISNNGPFIFKDSTSHDFDNSQARIIPNREHNPYIDAFWKWWPDLYNKLHTFRITGGEPLLSKHTFTAIDWLIENPNKKLEFSINTNLSIPETNWNKFVEKISLLKNNVKSVSVYTSIESTFDKANYSRRNINFKLLKKRVKFLLKQGVRVSIMSTYNIFAVTSFIDILKWIKDLRNNFDNIGIDIPYLKSPVYLDTQIVTDELLEEYIIPCLEYMKANNFRKNEINSMERIVNHINSISYDVSKHRSQFYDFVNQVDKRFNTDFKNVYPEMDSFLKTCKDSKESIIY
jgi:organic radical activating enzyme